MSPRRPKKASQLATALIEYSSDAIALVNEAGVVLYANPATAKMLGSAISDIIGSNVFRWVHDDDMPTFQANFERRLAQPGMVLRDAFRLRHKDGTWRHIESVGVNRLDDAGIRGIIINYRDVTESRRAEEALRSGEVRYRQLMEGASDIIYNCDLEGRFTFVNPTAVKLTKYSEAELVGRHFLTLIRPDYQDRARQFYDRQRREFIPSTYLEFPTLTKDGAELWIGQSVQVVESGGKPVGVQAIARDITARLALESQLRQAQKMEAIGRLAGGVAHDFNNILAAIMGSAELLSMQIESTDPRWEEADAIKRAADRGAALTRRLLAFSRPQQAAVTRVDVIAAAQNMEPMLRRLVLDRITIAFTAGAPATVQADESQIGQILMNLVVNARDAMPNGGMVAIGVSEIDLPHSAVSSLGIPAGRYAKLTVSDTGDGMTPEVQRQLFEPFFTTKGVDQGSGLGLSIVYTIVNSLGGAIEVWSELGQGAKFTIYLPAAVEGGP